MKEYANIIYEKKGNVVTITMNRPKALNALNSETLAELDDAIKTIADDKDVLGVIITGSGKAFVAGADIVQMKDYNPEEARVYFATAQNIFNSIESLEKPVIAAVNGFALGGGCELAMSCDIRFAGEKAVFGQPEVNLGIIPTFGGTQRLSRLVGTGIAKELIFGGEYIKADEALRIGLANRVIPQDDLLAETEKFMDVILKRAPLAVRSAKVAINRGYNMSLHDALELEKDLGAMGFATQDQKEGMGAFVEKREPKFQGK